MYLKQQDMFTMMPPEGRGIMIINPPYGERLEEEDIIEFYKSIGDALKRHFKGFDAWIISSGNENIKFIGLRPTQKIDLFNGSLECKFEKFEVFDGSLKDRNRE